MQTNLLWLYKCRISAPSSPPQHQFGVFALHVFVHHLQQQRPHDVRVILQFSVQRHRQQRGEITPSSGVEVRTALQRADELKCREHESRSTHNRSDCPKGVPQGSILGHLLFSVYFCLYRESLTKFGGVLLKFKASSPSFKLHLSI